MIDVHLSFKNSQSDYQPATLGEFCLSLLKAFLCLCGICLAVMLVGLTMVAGYSIFKAISDNQMFGYFGGVLGFSIGILELRLFRER